MMKAPNTDSDQESEHEESEHEEDDDQGSQMSEGEGGCSTANLTVGDIEEATVIQTPMGNLKVSRQAHSAMSDTLAMHRDQDINTGSTKKLSYRKQMACIINKSKVDEYARMMEKNDTAKNALEKKMTQSRAEIERIEFKYASNGANRSPGTVMLSTVKDGMTSQANILTLLRGAFSPQVNDNTYLVELCADIKEESSLTHALAVATVEYCQNIEQRHKINANVTTYNQLQAAVQPTFDM
jgi:hypothetical protein